MNDYEAPQSPLSEPPPPVYVKPKMHPVLKGCLIIGLILVGLFILAVGACFALVLTH